MRTSTILTACLFLFAAPALADVKTKDKGTEVKIEEKFQAIAAKELKSEFKTRFIASEADLKRVWSKVGGDAKLPEVDFSKHILLVMMANANYPRESDYKVSKDAKGVLSVTYVFFKGNYVPSDKMKFNFLKVSRDGATGVKREDEDRKVVVDPLPK